MTPKPFKFLLFSLTFFLPAAAMFADDVNWLGSNMDALWSNGNNWDVLPVNGRGDTIVFPQMSLSCTSTNDQGTFELQGIRQEKDIKFLS